MNHYLTRCVAGAIALSSMFMIGCETSGPNEYNPHAKPTQLAAYAASLHYPANLQAQSAADLVALVNRQSGQLTILNLSNQPLSDFNIGQPLRRQEGDVAFGPREAHPTRCRSLAGASALGGIGHGLGQRQPQAFLPGSCERFGG